MASLIHTEERAERLPICTDSVDLYMQEGVGGARPRRDSKRRLLSVAKFARRIELVSELGCNRYCNPKRSPTGNFGGVTTVSVDAGKSPFRVVSDPSEALGKADASVFEKTAWPSLRRTAKGSCRQAKLTMRSGMPSSFTSRAAIRIPPEGPTKSMDCSPPSPS